MEYGTRFEEIGEKNNTLVRLFYWCPAYVSFENEWLHILYKYLSYEAIIPVIYEKSVLIQLVI